LDLEHNNTSAAHQRVIRALELSPDFAPAQLLEAEVAAAQGNVAGALARIEQIYSENPHLNRLHLRMNALHMELQDYPRAEQDLRRYLYVKPDAQPVLLQLGRIQAEQEDFTEATKTFQTLIDLAPQESLAYFELGRVLEQRQEEKRALDLYRSAAQTLDRNVQEFEYLQAKLLLELHENASAADVLRSSLEREDSPQLRLLYGYALFELEQYAEAVPQLRTAAEALEFNPMAWLYLGKALAALEQWYDAIAAFQQVDAGEGRTEALIHLAGLYHLVDFNRDAISVLNELLDLEISAPILYQHLSYLHTLEGARQAAVATLEQGIEQYPASAELKYRLGLLQAMLGDYSAALEYMEQVLPEYPDDIELLNNIAYLYAETEQKLESAALLARKALNQEERPEFHDTLGWVYFKQQRFALALKHLRLAHEMSPRDPHILNHLGDVYSVIGQKAQAAEAYRKSEILSRNNNDLSK
jgi:tetratricopeptide (TPR) repeat protein